MCSEQFPENGQMDPLLMRFLIRRAESSISEIARSLRVPSEGGDIRHLSHVSVIRVIDGKGRSQRVENAIADLLCRTKHELWPQWYGPDEKPIRKRKRVLSRHEKTQRFAAAAAEFNALIGNTKQAA
jgi:hypothetical protein